MLNILTEAKSWIKQVIKLVKNINEIPINPDLCKCKYEKNA